MNTKPNVTRYATTSYNRYQRMKGRQDDIFARARAYKFTHEQMLAARTALYETADYQRLTYAQRFGLSELWSYEQSVLWREDLEWRLGPASGPVRTAHDPWTEEMSQWSRQPGALFGAHFWKGTDRPFSEYSAIN